MPDGPDGLDPLPPPTATAVVDDGTPAGDLGITVSLDQFNGPMDLLLYLVRRAEVDITDLPVTVIADQFAAWVAAAAGTTLDLEAAGDFVVLAATLLEIKARMVAPPPEGTEVADDGEDAFDPRTGLIRKLLVYRAAKEAAFDLDHRDDAQRLRHHRGHREVVPDDASEIDAWELKDVGPGTIANLWFDLLKRIDGLGPRTVLVDDVPMVVRMAQVVEDMRSRGEGRLSELFTIDNGPIARVGIVMAVLECTRQRILRVNQAEQYGDVRIAFRPEDDRAVGSGDPGPPDMLPKRQRRPPLVTWDGAAAPDSDAPLGDEDPTAENEEQRFLRELESTVGVERLLHRAADLERGFISWWEETHPGEPLPHGVVKPEPPPPLPPPPEAKPMVVASSTDAPVKPRRQPKTPALPTEAVPAIPAAAIVAATPAAEAPEIPLPQPGSPSIIPDFPAGVIEATPSPAAEPIAQRVQATPSFDIVPLVVEHAVVVPEVVHVVDAPATVEALTPSNPPAEVTEAVVLPGPEIIDVAEPSVTAIQSVTEATESATAAHVEVATAPPTDVEASAPVNAAVAPIEPSSESLSESAGQDLAGAHDAIAPNADPVLALTPEEPVIAALPEDVVASVTRDVVAEIPPVPEPEPLSEPVSASGEADRHESSIGASFESNDSVFSLEAVAIPPIQDVVAVPQADVIEQPPFVEPVAMVSPPAEAIDSPAVAAEPLAHEPSPVATPRADSPSTADRASLVAGPPPDPLPPPPPPPPPPRPVQTANTPPTPAIQTTPSKPAQMPRPRHLKLAALTALWVVSTVGLVAWFQRPASVLTISGPHDSVVARDAEISWALNLPLDAEHLAEASLPVVDPPTAGSVAWRDERTCVFTPAGVLPAAGSVSVRFDDKLRARGGFRFDAKNLPSLTVRTLPAVSVADPSILLPAFGEGRIDLALSRVPADPAVLLAAVAISPAVSLRKEIVDGHLRLSGPFAPGQTYRLTVADTVPGRADDRPLAWQGDIVMPQRTPGARLAGGVGRVAAIEAVNLGWVTVENAAGAREVVRFTPALGDSPSRAELPPWLLGAGENHLQLRWPGGSGEVTITRHDLPMVPADGAPALLGGTLPVVSVR